MKNNQQVILVSIVIIIGLGLISNSFAEMKLIPDWIKNTAGWWASDEISEAEFVNAIEFLVNNGIIQVHVNVDKKTYAEIINEFDSGITSEDQTLIEIDKLLPFYSGYRGAAFDGESVYFSPYYSNHGRHGWVMKYDTSKPFDDPNSWRTFNTATVATLGTDVLVITTGFQGALYNNGHVYFVPYFIEDGDLGSRVVIYDTKLDFGDRGAWQWKGLFGAFEDGVVEIIPRANLEMILYNE